MCWGGAVLGEGSRATAAHLRDRPSPVAFILAGNMAVAYFLVHAPRGFFPLLNGGELAIAYCFVFLYFWIAGGGEWSLDRVREPASAPTLSPRHV